MGPPFRVMPCSHSRACKCLSISALGSAPTNVLTSIPLLNKIMVGMLWMLY